MNKIVKSMKFMKTNEMYEKQRNCLKSNHIDKINQINRIHIDPDTIPAS